MKPEACKSLAQAVGNLFWRGLRQESDETARYAPIRAAIAHLRDYAACHLQADPDFLARDSVGGSTSEAERIPGNVRYWIDHLPKGERGNYSGVAAFVRAVSVSVASRKAAQWQIDKGQIGRSRDMEKLLRFTFEQFGKGKIANA